MGLFGRKDKAKESDERTQACEHPVSQQLNLYEDSMNPHRITGIRCGQCGDVVPMEAFRKAS